MATHIYYHNSLPINNKKRKGANLDFKQTKRECQRVERQRMKNAVNAPEEI